MPRLIVAIQVVLSLVTIMGLATGCELLSPTSTPSSTPAPPASEYPADISGRVTIADTVVADLPKSHKKVEHGYGPWWIVDVVVKNKNYEKPITSIWDTSISMPVGEEHFIWSIVIDDKVWGGLKSWSGFPAGDTFPQPPMIVPKGESGKTTFLFRGPDVSPNDAQICYRGQEPYSYGRLTGGDRVAVYDWDLKKAVQEPKYVPVSPPPKMTKIAAVQGMWVSNWVWGYDYALCVELKPTGSASANKVYTVELSEKSRLRDSTTVRWNQPDINVLKAKTVYFSVTRSEFNAYLLEDVSHIFSVKVHE